MSSFRQEFTRLKYVVNDLKTRRLFRYFLLIINTAWRFIVPPLWVTAVYLLNLLVWLFYTLRYQVTFYRNILLLSLVFLGVGLILIPFDESQNEVIQVANLFTQCIDAISNGIGIPTFNDVVKCTYTICRLITIFWDVLGFILRFATTLLREYMVNDFANDLEVFLNFTSPIPEIPIDEVPAVVNAIIDYLDISVCDFGNASAPCQGNFYSQWDNQAIFSNLDLFWPPGPDKRAVSYNEFLAGRQARFSNERISDGHAMYRGDLPFYRQDMMDDEPTSEWNSFHQAERAQFTRDLTRQIQKRNSTTGDILDCCFPFIPGTDVNVFALFLEGTNGFDTLVLGFVCGELDAALEQVVYFFLWILELGGELMEYFIGEFNSLDLLNAPQEIFFFFVELIFQLLLNIPCLEFNSQESLLVSIIDCTCEGINATVGSTFPLDQYFMYFPSTTYGDLPGHLTCCVGLCCFTGNTGEFPNDFNTFIDYILNDCLGGIIPSDSDDIIPSDFISKRNTQNEHREQMQKELESFAGIKRTNTTAERLSSYEHEYFPMGVDNSNDPYYQEVRNAMETREEAAKYPKWLQDTAVEVMYQYGKVVHRLAFAPPDNIVERYQFMRDVGASMSAPIHRTIAGQTVVSDMISKAVRKVTGALFYAIDHRFSRYGMKRPIKRKYLDPYASEEDLRVSGRNIYRDHWLRRYAESTPIDEESTVTSDDEYVYLTDGQLSARALVVMVNDVLEIYNGITWSDVTYQYRVPSYTDVQSHLVRNRFGHSMWDFGTHFFHAIRQEIDQKYPPGQRNSAVVHAHTTATALMYRIIAPDMMDHLETKYQNRGGAYDEASYAVVRPLNQEYKREKARYTKEIVSYVKPNTPRETVKQVESKVDLFLTTSTMKLYTLYHYEHKIRRRKEMERRKVSYDFQRRLATKMNVTLASMNPNLEIPENPEEPVTLELASMYRLKGDKIVKVRDKTGFVWRTMDYGYQYLSGHVPRRARGVDPEVIRIFRNAHMSMRRPDPFFNKGFLWTSEGMMEKYSQHLGKATRVAGDALPQLQTRLPVLSTLSTVGSLGLALLKQWRWVSVLIVPVISSPQFLQGGRILINPWVDIFADIYKEGLKPTFSESRLEQFGLEVGFSVVDTFYYLFTEIIRFLMCNIYPLTVEIITSLLNQFLSLIAAPIAIILSPVKLIISASALFSPLYSVCPPEQQLDSDGVPVLFPWNYVFALIDADPTQPCTDSSDCIAFNQCASPEGNGNFISYFYILPSRGNSGVYPGNTGRCLPWPRFPCAFQLGTVNFSAPFEQTCDAFGWETKNIVWYQNPTLLEFIEAHLNNWYVGTRFITRLLAGGFMPFFSTSVVILLLLLPAAVFFSLQRYRIAFFFLIVLFVTLVGGTVVTDFITDNLVPFLEDVEDIPLFGYVAELLLDLIRFPNFSDSDPLGSPSGGEFVCVIFNSPSFFIGISLFTGLLGLFLGFVSSGGFLGTLAYLLFWLLYPFRRFFDCCVLIISAPNYPDGGYGDPYAGEPYDDEGVNEEDIYEMENTGDYGDPYIDPTLESEDTDYYGATIGAKQLTGTMSEEGEGVGRISAIVPIGNQQIMREQESIPVYTRQLRNRSGQKEETPKGRRRRKKKKNRVVPQKPSLSRLVPPGVRDTFTVMTSAVPTQEQDETLFSYLSRSVVDGSQSITVRGAESLMQTGRDTMEQLGKSRIWDENSWKPAWE